MTPTDSSPPSSSVHGILQAGILEWATIPFSRGPSQPRDQAQVSLLAGRFFTIWATREACGRDQMGQKLGSESHQLSEPHFLICKMQLKNVKWYVRPNVLFRPPSIHIFCVPDTEKCVKRKAYYGQQANINKNMNHKIMPLDIDLASDKDRMSSVRWS